MIGLTRKKTLTLIEAPQDENFLMSGDILSSSKAFYLVHSVRKVKSNIYRYKYAISCTRLCEDDEAIAYGRHYPISTADKAYLQRASRVESYAT